MALAKGPGTSSPAQECCRNSPEIRIVERLFTGLRLRSTVLDGLFCSLGPLLQRGGQGQREQWQDPLEQRGVLFGDSSPHPTSWGPMCL